MQGAASATVGDSNVVWASSSYGPIRDSHLQLLRAALKRPASTNILAGEVRIFGFPLGLEKLYVEH